MADIGFFNLEGRRRMDGRTDRSSIIDARTHLKAGKEGEREKEKHER